VEARDNVFTPIDTALQAGEPYLGIYYPNDTTLTFIYPAANGCDSMVVVMLMCLVIHHINHINTSPYTLFPNPTSGEVIISSEAYIKGLEVWKCTWAVAIRPPIQPARQQTINLDHLPMGLTLYEYRLVSIGM
jgi:hypothetical protein